VTDVIRAMLLPGMTMTSTTSAAATTTDNACGSAFPNYSDANLISRDAM